MGRDMDIRWPGKGYVAVSERIDSDGRQLYYVEGIIRGIHSRIPVPLNKRKSFWRYIQGEISSMNHIPKPRVVFNNNYLNLYPLDQGMDYSELVLEEPLDLARELLQLEDELILFDESGPGEY